MADKVHLRGALRAIGLGGVSAALVALGLAVASVRRPPEITRSPEISRSPRPAPVVVLDEVTVSAAPLPPREALPLTAEQRNLGFDECFLPDPVGLGPYAPYRKTKGLLARIAIPQQGGHTEDLGYDVIVHFHGGDPVRKQFVQVVGGTVFVAVDLGVGSEKYERAFVPPERWPALKAEITRALREHTGDARAHVRHLALSAWSAGYGAVNEILKVHGDSGIDAVVLLDALHAGRNYRWPYHDGTLQSLSAGPVRAIYDYAVRAARGDKLFVLTHSDVVPTGYASVRRSADLLLAEVGLSRSPQERAVGLLTQRTAVDSRGLHVWGYAGRYEEAHCSHVTLLGPIVRDLLEPAWDTPPMSRDVPNTPAPVLGNGATPRKIGR